MEIIFAGCIIGYCLLVVWLHYHWLQIPLFRSDKDCYDIHASLKVSVIIPLRNEAAHIVPLLQDLAQQRLNETRLFPTNHWEVIVVNDDSEDDTVALVEEFQSRALFHLQLIKSLVPQKSHSPKKAALYKGIQSADGEVILTIDGDCRIGPYWLVTWASFFQKHQPALVAGGVTFCQEQSWFERLQTIEFASLIGMGAASIQSKRPITCNGANLAFRREAFYEVGGYQGHWHIPSGDDEFLLHAMFRKFPTKIYFLKSPEAVVKTYAKRTVNEFVQQRKRWAGKWRMHREGAATALAALVFGFHLLFIVTLLFWTFYDVGSQWLVWLLLLKIGVEYVFIKSVLGFLKKKLNPINFLCLQVLYSAYFVLIGIIASIGGYTWKNRTHNHRD
jgi:cellulose synthase/poly-beta-1,6-N-acetylglucosamine synthase-like glycosyltransferase